MLGSHSAAMALNARQGCCRPALGSSKASHDIRQPSTPRGPASSSSSALLMRRGTNLQQQQQPSSHDPPERRPSSARAGTSNTITSTISSRSHLVVSKKKNSTSCTGPRETGSRGRNKTTTGTTTGTAARVVTATAATMRGRNSVNICRYGVSTPIQKPGSSGTPSVRLFINNAPTEQPQRQGEEESYNDAVDDTVAVDCMHGVDEEDVVYPAPDHGDGDGPSSHYHTGDVDDDDEIDFGDYLDIEEGGTGKKYSHERSSLQGTTAMNAGTVVKNNGNSKNCGGKGVSGGKDATTGAKGLEQFSSIAMGRGRGGLEQQGGGKNDFRKPRPPSGSTASGHAFVVGVVRSPRAGSAVRSGTGNSRKIKPHGNSTGTGSSSSKAVGSTTAGTRSVIPSGGAGKNGTATTSTSATASSSNATTATAVMKAALASENRDTALIITRTEEERKKCPTHLSFEKMNLTHIPYIEDEGSVSRVALPSRFAESLSLQYNSIRTIENLGCFERLHTLDLSFNSLEGIPGGSHASSSSTGSSSGAANLHDASGVTRTTSSTPTTTSPRTTNPSGTPGGGSQCNPLLAVSMSLKRLYLRNNRIQDVTHNNLGGLLALKHTLQILDLSANELPAIPVDIFTHLTALIELNLSRNGIEHLKGLQSLRLLQKLDVRDNKLKSVQGLHLLPRLKVLLLSGNDQLFLFPATEDRRSGDELLHIGSMKCSTCSGNGVQEERPRGRTDSTSTCRSGTAPVVLPDQWRRWGRMSRQCVLSCRGLEELCVDGATAVQGGRENTQPSLDLQKTTDNASGGSQQQQGERNNASLPSPPSSSQPPLFSQEVLLSCFEHFPRLAVLNGQALDDYRRLGLGRRLLPVQGQGPDPPVMSGASAELATTTDQEGSPTNVPSSSSSVVAPTAAIPSPSSPTPQQLVQLAQQRAQQLRVEAAGKALQRAVADLVRRKLSA